MTWEQLINRGPVWAPADEGGGEPAGEPAGEKSESLLGAAPAEAPETPEGEEPAEAPTGEEGKEPAEEPPVPLTVADLALPEGMELDAGASEGFLSLLNDGELTRAELGQKLIGLQVEVAQKAQATAAEAVQTLWTKQQAEWQSEARALPEIGGDQFETTLAQIKMGMRQAGATEATFDALNESGLGDHPELIRVLHALTKDLGEGGPQGGTPPKGNLSQAERMYGT